MVEKAGSVKKNLCSFLLHLKHVNKRAKNLKKHFKNIFTDENENINNTILSSSDFPSRFIPFHCPIMVANQITKRLDNLKNFRKLKKNQTKQN